MGERMYVCGLFCLGVCLCLFISVRCFCLSVCVHLYLIVCLSLLVLFVGVYMFTFFFVSMCFICLSFNFRIVYLLTFGHICLSVCVYLNIKLHCLTFDLVTAIATITDHA